MVFWAWFEQYAASFAPQTTGICTLCGKSPELLPGYVVESPSCGEELPELWLQRNAQDAPLLQPFPAGILRLRKSAFFTAKRAV
jgi:hypothetical protein